MARLDDLLNEPDTPLKRATTINKAQITGWLQEAGKKLDDARRKENASSTRVDAAYDAVFFCVLTVLATQKVRVTAQNGHHNAALQAAAVVMNVPEGLQDTVEVLKDWRNSKYTGAFTASEQDVMDALDIARRYMELTSGWLQQEHSALLK
ncbi:hypothetical protein [Burkholderia aenigmatica]|uniref:DNA-binding protein n=1 Tax=Burkholderia aenigmatica TaxID=2015348 RepID=A0A228I2A4_9BURK|nr:hypothetical protein [Burkholderia aenigmatica]OXI36332.1 hypothetical protein CFB84_34875 [Burkholderia aenigmatica]